MPTIPVFKPNTNLAGVPGVRQQDSASPAAFGANVAQATGQVGGELAQMGGELSRLGAQIQERQDAIAAKDAYQRASEQVLTFMHDPKEGILSKRGSQARGLTNQATKGLEQIQSEVVKGLTPAQRRLFDSFWDGTKQSSITASARHEADQIRVAEDQTNDAIIASASSAVAANAYDPKTIQHHIEVGVGTLASKHRGATKDVFDRAVMEFKTAAFSGAVHRMLNDGRTAEAKAMFEQHKEEMDQRLTGDLEKTINHMNDQAFAQKMGDELSMKYPSPEDEDKAMAEIQKTIQDPVKRALVEARTQALFADKRRYEQARLQARVEQVTGTVFAAPSMAAGRSIVDGITDLKVRAQAEQAFRIRFAEDLQLRAHARSIQMSEAAEKRREGRQEAKFDQYQQVYETIAPLADGDPTKLTGIIRKQYSGADEENLVRYALGRMQEERPRTAKATLREQVFREGAKQETLTRMRAFIDQERDAGRAVTPDQILAKVTSPEFTAADGSPMIDDQGVKDLAKYSAGQGKYGEVSSADVNNAIRALGLKTTTGKPKDSDDFPGIYEMVLARVRSGEKPTHLDLQNIAKQILVEQAGTKPGMLGSWWSVKPATAYEAVKLGTAFNVAADPADAAFLRSMAMAIPQVTKMYHGMKIDEDQQQEFIDQVLAPELTTGQPPVFPIGSDGKGLHIPKVQEFLAWSRREHQELFKNPANLSIKAVARLYNLYQESFRNAQK